MQLATLSASEWQCGQSWTIILFTRQKSLQNKIRADKQNPPAFAMILTAAGDAYTTAEGIHVVPINKLRA